MKKVYILICLIISIMIYSCKKSSEPSVDDNFLNYKIDEVPVTDDYHVGAFYINYGTFNNNATEVPVVGKYSFTNGVPPAGVMAKHIAFAKTAKLDYFIFQVNSANLNFNAYKT